VVEAAAAGAAVFFVAWALWARCVLWAAAGLAVAADATIGAARTDRRARLLRAIRAFMMVILRFPALCGAVRPDMPFAGEPDAFGCMNFP
jgi:hypothetical protein